MNIKDIRNLDRDVLLGLLGMEARRSATEKAISGVGYLGAGLLLGTGIGLLMATKPGAQLRGDLSTRVRQAVPQGFMSRGNGGAPSSEGSPV